MSIEYNCPVCRFTTQSSYSNVAKLGDIIICVSCQARLTIGKVTYEFSEYRANGY